MVSWVNASSCGPSVLLLVQDTDMHPSIDAYIHLSASSSSSADLALEASIYCLHSFAHRSSTCLPLHQLGLYFGLHERSKLELGLTYDYVTLRLTHAQKQTGQLSSVAVLGSLQAVVCGGRRRGVAGQC